MDMSIEGGFADPVLGAQAVFRASMEALARPGQTQEIGTEAAPPAPLTPELGALALSLIDADSPVWLDAALAAAPEVAAWLRFHCGAVLTEDPAAAAFALVAEPALLPELSRFGQGSDEYPDRSTTLLVAATAPAQAVRLRGPGIKDELVTDLPLPTRDFLAQWAENRARFPRGVDLLLAGDGYVTGLPRSTRLSEA
jgi:alpha-D-ribose 1-methylphosphonate 5-triphosphate synthase subunit PhnH